jgi:hypothetical protein
MLSAEAHLRRQQEASRRKPASKGFVVRIPWERSV